MTDGERTRGRTTKFWHGDTDGDAPTEAPVHTAPSPPPDDDDDAQTVLDPRAKGPHARHATVLPDDHRSAFTSHTPSRSPRLRTERRQPPLPGTREAPHDLSHTQPFPRPHPTTLVSPPDTLPAPPAGNAPAAPPAPNAHAGMRSSARARRVVMLPHGASIADANPRAPTGSTARPAAWSAAWKVAAAVCALALAFWGGTRWASRGASEPRPSSTMQALRPASSGAAEPVPVTPIAVAVEPSAETRLDHAPTPQVVDGGVGSVALPGR